jgi:DNA-binding response OmpR family regulator
LRRKLELDPDHPRYLLTERGVGYRLVSTANTAQLT